MVHSSVKRNLFLSQNPISPTIIPSLTRSEPMHSVTSESQKKSVASSNRSRRLCSGALRGCANCIILEGMLNGERKARHKTFQNSKEARERCLDLETVLYMVGQYLHQANEQFDTLVGFIEATTDSNDGDPNMPEALPEVIHID